MKSNNRPQPEANKPVKSTGHVIVIGNADCNNAWVFARLADYTACRAWLVQEGYPIHFSRPFTHFLPDTFAWWVPIVVQFGIWPKSVVEGFPND